MEYIRKLMAGLEPEKANVGMGGGKQQRMFNRDNGILVAVKEQCRLGEGREGREATGILDELKIEGHFAKVRVVEDGDGALPFPGCDAGGTEIAQPETVKIEGGGEQDEATDFWAVGSIKRREIAAEAGTDESRGLAGQETRNEVELPCDGQVLEVALREIGDFDLKTSRAEVTGEEPRLARGGAGGEAMEIEDTQLVRQHLMLTAGGVSTIPACQESAGWVESLTEIQARISHRFAPRRSMM